MEELRSHDNTADDLRPTSRFVSIDSPHHSGTGPLDFPNAEKSGGRYVSINSSQLNRVSETALSEFLGDKGALGEIATWAPRDSLSGDEESANIAKQRAENP